MSEKLLQIGSRGGFRLTSKQEYDTIGLEKLLWFRVASTTLNRKTTLSWRIALDTTVPPHAQKGKTFIYGLKDPDTQLIRYIGKTDNPHRRLIDHQRHSRYNHSDKSIWIADLLARGLKPELEIIEEVSSAEWQERERYWIAYYREQGMPLTNVLAGGNALPETYKRSAATCALISQIHRGMTKTPEQKAAQSALYKELGIKPPPQAHDILRQRLKGKSVPPETLAKKHATMQERKLMGAYNKPRQPASESLRAIRKSYMSEYWDRERSQGHRAILTNEQAAIIKFNVYGLLQKEYAEMFGVSIAAVSAIVCGVRYKHITREHLPSELQGRDPLPVHRPGRDSRGRRLPKLTDEQAAIAKFNVYGLTHREYAELFGVSSATISVIVNGHYYQHITREHLPLSCFQQTSLWENMEDSHV